MWSSSSSIVAASLFTRTAILAALWLQIFNLGLWLVENWNRSLLIVGLLSFYVWNSEPHHSWMWQSSGSSLNNNGYRTAIIIAHIQLLDAWTFIGGSFTLTSYADSQWIKNDSDVSRRPNNAGESFSCWIFLSRLIIMSHRTSTFYSRKTVKLHANLQELFAMLYSASAMAHKPAGVNGHYVSCQPIPEWLYFISVWKIWHFE